MLTGPVLTDALPLPSAVKTSGKVLANQLSPAFANAA